jgi:hypothetical protein
MVDCLEVCNIIRIVNSENWVNSKVLYIFRNWKLVGKFLQMRFDIFDPVGTFYAQFLCLGEPTEPLGNIPAQNFVIRRMEKTARQYCDIRRNHFSSKKTGMMDLSDGDILSKSF